MGPLQQATDTSRQRQDLGATELSGTLKEQSRRESNSSQTKTLIKCRCNREELCDKGTRSSFAADQHWCGRKWGQYLVFYSMQHSHDRDVYLGYGLQVSKLHHLLYSFDNRMITGIHPPVRGNDLCEFHFSWFSSSFMVEKIKIQS